MGKGDSEIKANGTWDDGCMIAAMSKAKYDNVKDQMNGWEKATCQLRMANGEIVLSLAHWEGDIIIGGAREKATLEVFDSQSNWEVLVGKPIMEKFKLVHDYADDTVKVPTDGPPIILTNQATQPVAESGTAMVCMIEDSSNSNCGSR